jgi:hypothetical protein
MGKVEEEFAKGKPHQAARLHSVSVSERIAGLAGSTVRTFDRPEGCLW